MDSEDIYRVYDVKKFLNFCKLGVAEETTLGNRYLIEAKGIGIGELCIKVSDGKWQKCRLNKILYIPCHITFSVYQKLQSLEKTFVFTEKIVRFYMENEKQL